MQTEEREYVILNEVDNGYMKCEGPYPFYEAIGRIVCDIEDTTIEMIENNLRDVGKADDFYELEGQNGYGWSRTYIKEICNDITEHWYILELTK